MGFFDSIFGLGTSKSTQKAAGQANQLINATTGVTNQLLTDSADRAKGDITNYSGQARDALTGGVNQAVGTVQGSNGLFQPFASTGTAANGMLGNALGLNGQAGNDAATAAFQTSPGYQFSVDQATDAAARKAASLGMAGSGNTLDAVTRLAGNLADQQYGSFLDRLQGLGSQGLTAAGAISGNNALAGGYQYGGGGALATLLNGTGTNLGNIDSNLGTNLTNNAWNATSAVNGNNLSAARAQDVTDSNNNGIFSKLLLGGAGSSGGGGILGSVFSGFKL